MDFENEIKQCIKALEAGGTILYPTDTVWGIGCNALSEDAVDRVFEVKKRPKEKSLVVLLADARDILKYIAAPHPDIIDILEHFETPTTVIYDSPLGFPDNVVAQDGSLAIRVPDDPFCTALLKRYRRPIVSTSANISGEPTPAFFHEVAESIVAGVEYVVSYRQDDIIPRKPSRIVRINEDGSLHILRA